MESPQRAEHQVSVDYLRTFLVLLVLLHHSIVAYNPYALPALPSMTTEPRWWRAMPVVDQPGWLGFTLIGIFNDTFFMSLTFFVSGLFVWRSLRSKGTARFVRARLLRLGVPFLLAALIAPVAYYPAYLMTPGDHTPESYARLWLSFDDWVAGPAWFVWVLLAFNCLAALSFKVSPSWADGAGRRLAAMGESPAKLFGALVGLSLLVYVPLVTVLGPYDWVTVGPFSVQTSRILLYCLYFAAGIAVGTQRLEDSLLAPQGSLARQWLVWAGVALAAYAALIAVLVRLPVPPATSRMWNAIGALPFVVSCAAWSFLWVSAFVRFARRQSFLIDRLSENSYGMYLVHYGIVTWLQYAMLTSPVPAVAKGVCVFVVSVMASWLLVQVLRQAPAVARVI